MKWLSRVVNNLFGRARSSPLDSVPTEELLAMAEKLLRQSIQGYRSSQSRLQAGYAEAEYAAFIFFWIKHWHDQQPNEVTSDTRLLDILKYQVEDAVPTIKSYHSTNHFKGWEPFQWIDDRVRIYQSIVTLESQGPKPSGPPSIFVACHLLAAISSQNRSLKLLPAVKNTSGLMKLSLDSGIFGDALDQLSIFQHAINCFEESIPKITEIIGELHFRRIANSCR